MKTDAVMCMALTKQRPSPTPLLLTSFSICGVILMNPRRAGTSSQRCSVSAFNASYLQPEKSLGATRIAYLPGVDARSERNSMADNIYYQILRTDPGDCLRRR